MHQAIPKGTNRSPKWFGPTWKYEIDTYVARHTNQLCLRMYLLQDVFDAQRRPSCAVRQAIVIARNIMDGMHHQHKPDLASSNGVVNDTLSYRSPSPLPSRGLWHERNLHAQPRQQNPGLSYRPCLEDCDLLRLSGVRQYILPLRRYVTHV